MAAQSRSRRFVFLGMLALGCLSHLGVHPALGQGGLRINIERPKDREFIRDQADIILPADREQIRKIADKVLTDKAVPIIVVTINSMAEYVGPEVSIETFALLLFNQWGIGHKELNGAPWNRGILMVVSKYDRRARIELGAGWERDKDAVAAQIMDELMVPQFKNGEYSGGILAGVEALDRMARGIELPRKPRPWWHYALIVGFVGLAIFTVVSLIRRGASGWAWLMWAAIFGLLGYMLYNLLQGSRGSGSGGGFSGGSFGGGFSGGGGATGSW